MRLALLALMFCCFSPGQLPAEQDFATVVGRITAELQEIKNAGLQEARMENIRQGFQDIKQWNEKSEEIGRLSRESFITILSALQADPTNEAGVMSLYIPMNTLWSDFPHLDAKKAAAATERFLKSAAKEYAIVRRSLLKIKKPEKDPVVPHIPESHLRSNYLSGPPPRPEEIADEADRAVYKQAYENYFRDLAAWSKFRRVPRQMALLDQTLVDVLRIHPDRDVGKIEAQMAFFQMAGIPKPDIERIILGKP